MQNNILQIFIIAALIVVSAAFFIWDTPFLYVQEIVAQNRILGSVLFVSIFVLATVIAPIAAMPIIPSTAVLLGPLLTALLSILGWTLGAVIAFLIARYAGRPLLRHFVSLDQIEKYERLIPEDTQFVTVVLLRMIMPVDVLSYVLGLTITMSLWKYTIATALGVTVFSFTFAYMGDAFYGKDLTTFTLLTCFTLFILLVGWYLVRQKKESKLND